MGAVGAPRHANKGPAYQETCLSGEDPPPSPPVANPAPNWESHKGEDEEFHDAMESLPNKDLWQQPLQQMHRVPPEEWPQQQQLQQMPQLPSPEWPRQQQELPGPPQEQAWALLQEPRDQEEKCPARLVPIEEAEALPYMEFIGGKWKEVLLVNNPSMQAHLGPALQPTTEQLYLEKYSST